MSDFLQAGQAWLARQLTEHVSREVTYRRGTAEVVLRATIGKTTGEQDTGDGLVLRAEIRDYLIDTGSLWLGGAPFLPEQGDWIIESDQSQTFVYEVLPIGNQKAWRYSDPFRLKVRIHTKLISSETID